MNAIAISGVEMSAPFGILNVNKPAGISSRHAVDRVAGLVYPAKAGHAGTLDPIASGVLIVCVGKATRLVDVIHTFPKVYRARFLLGRSSSTDDLEGEVIEISGARRVERAELENILPSFVGNIRQTPPQFSAVHVGGRRAYQWARRGRAVDLSPRIVEVYRIEIVDFAYPAFELEIECGKGTYIRALGRDIGERLKTSAVMAELTRLRVGPFDLAAAVEFDSLSAETLPRLMLPASTAVAHFAQHRLSDAELAEVGHGRQFAAPGEANFAEGQLIALLAPDGELAALGLYRREAQTIAPKHVFIPRE